METKKSKSTFRNKLLRGVAYTGISLIPIFNSGCVESLALAAAGGMQASAPGPVQYQSIDNSLIYEGNFIPGQSRLRKGLDNSMVSTKKFDYQGKSITSIVGASNIAGDLNLDGYFDVNNEVIGNKTTFKKNEKLEFFFKFEKLLAPGVLGSRSIYGPNNQKIFTENFQFPNTVGPTNFLYSKDPNNHLSKALYNVGGAGNYKITVFINNTPINSLDFQITE